MMRPTIATAPISPLLAALGICLPYAANNLTQLELLQIASIAAASLGLSVILMLLLGWYIRSAMRAAVCTSATIYCGFTLPQALAEANLPDAATGTILLTAAIAVAWFVIASRRSPSDYRFGNLLCNAIFLALLIVPSMQLVRNIPAVAFDRVDGAELFPDVPVPSNGAANADEPDIWHLVMDRYADSRTLSEFYQFDNSPFLDALRARGFSVVDGARSNYQRTAHSLASTLNFDYLDAMGRDSRVFRADFVPIFRAIQDSRAARFFNRAGYHMVQVASWWEATRRGRYEDENLGYRAIPDFLRLILERSLVGYALSAAGVTNGRIDQCRRMQYQFDAMTRLAADPRKKYVFAHLLLPHPPYVLTANGACKSKADADQMTRRDNYVDQVIYANSALLNLIDHILAGKRPAVVLLHADEGPWPEILSGDETELGLDVTHTDWSKASPSELREKTGILLAVRGLDRGDMLMSDHATPVNLYRQVLNTYFGYELPLLPDRSYVFRDRANLYDFIDVTEKVQ